MADPAPTPPDGFVLDASPAPQGVPTPLIPRTPAPQTPAQASIDTSKAATDAEGVKQAQYKTQQEQIATEKQQLQKWGGTEDAYKLINGVERARGLVNDWSTGLTGSALQHVPSTDAYALNNIINQEVRGNVFMQRISALKEENPSPNGGTGIGRIMQAEIPMITGSSGTLDIGVKGSQLNQSFDQIEHGALRFLAKQNGENPDDPNVIAKYKAQALAAVNTGSSSGGSGSPPSSSGAPSGLPSSLTTDQQAKDKEFLATNPTPAQYTSFLSTLIGRPVDAKAAEDRLKASNAGGSYSGGVVQGLIDNTKNDVAGLAQGAASLPDMLATGVGKVASVVPNAVGYGLDQLGYHNAANWIQQNVTHPLANPPTIGGAIESVAPTPNTTFGRVNRAVGQFAGAAAAFPSSAAERAIANFVGEVPKPPLPPPSPATIVNDGADNGIKVMTSDVAPPKTFLGKAAQAIGERIPLTGTGGVRAAQQQQRVAAIKSLAQDYGAASGDALTSPAVDSVAEGLANQRGAELTRLTGQKDAVLANVAGTVPTPNAVAAIDQQVARLSGINADAYAPVINKLQSFRDQLTSGKTLQQIEGNRKLLGDMFSDPSLASIKTDGEKAINAIYGPLRDDMGAFIKGNGSPGDFSRWQSANQGLASMAGDLQNAALKRALNTSDSTPENVGSLLFSQKPSDVRLLYANLSPDGRAKAQAAILQKAIESSGGMDNLSPDRFVNQVGSLGKSIGVFFKDDDLTRIQGLTRVLDATRRAGQAAVAPPTGVQAVPYAMGAGFTELFGIPGGLSAAAGTGLLARAYESAPVRNILLRLGRSSEGSAQEGALLQRATAAITAAVQKRAPNGALNDNLAQTGSAAASPNSGPNQKQ